MKVLGETGGNEEEVDGEIGVPGSGCEEPSGWLTEEHWDDGSTAPWESALTSVKTAGLTAEHQIAK